MSCEVDSDLEFGDLLSMDVGNLDKVVETRHRQGSPSTPPPPSSSSSSAKASSILSRLQAQQELSMMIEYQPEVAPTRDYTLPAVIPDAIAVAPAGVLPEYVIILIEKNERPTREWEQDSIVQALEDLIKKEAKENKDDDRWNRVFVCTPKIWEEYRLKMKPKGHGDRAQTDDEGTGHHTTKKGIIMGAIAASGLTSAMFTFGDFLLLDQKGRLLRAIENKSAPDLQGCLFGQAYHHMRTQIENAWTLKTDLRIPVEWVISGMYRPSKESEAKAVIRKTVESDLPWFCTYFPSQLPWFIALRAVWHLDPAHRLKQSQFLASNVMSHISKEEDLSPETQLKKQLMTIKGIGSTTIYAIINAGITSPALLIDAARRLGRETFSKITTAEDRIIGEHGKNIWDTLGITDETSVFADPDAEVEIANIRLDAPGSSSKKKKASAPRKPKAPPKPSHADEDSDPEDEDAPAQPVNIVALPKPTVAFTIPTLSKKKPGRKLQAQDFVPEPISEEEDEEEEEVELVRPLKRLKRNEDAKVEPLPTAIKKKHNYRTAADVDSQLMAAPNTMRNDPMEVSPQLEKFVMDRFAKQNAGVKAAQEEWKARARERLSKMGVEHIQ